MTPAPTCLRVSLAPVPARALGVLVAVTFVTVGAVAWAAMPMPTPPNAGPNAGPRASSVAPAPSLPPAEVAETGAVPYEGPRTTEELLRACAPKVGSDAIPCYTGHLELMIEGLGAEAAFTVLADLASRDVAVNSESHRMAHDLGRHALLAYGTIQRAMENCSYKVFAGCFHGALQAHFEGGKLNPSELQGLCPSDNAFRQYTCLHGMGHGLLLATKHQLNESLGLCDLLASYYAQGSCHGGVFMENLVGYLDAQRGAGHVHEGDHTPVFVVDPSNPMYPCDVVKENHRTSCWLLQTSFILHFNRGDFRDAAATCTKVPKPHDDTCFRSLGRDAAPYTNRDVPRAMEHCGHAPGIGRALCVRGFVAESVLNYATPEAGISVCKQVPEQDKPPCYDEVGIQGRGMLDADAMARVCDTAETAHRGSCRAGALLR